MIGIWFFYGKLEMFERWRWHKKILDQTASYFDSVYVPLYRQIQYHKYSQNIEWNFLAVRMGDQFQLYRNDEYNL